MRVKNYQGTTYYTSTGSSFTKLYPFTHEHADSVGGVLEEDGLDVVLAQKLCNKWTIRGRGESIRYSYQVVYNG